MIKKDTNVSVNSMVESVKKMMRSAGGKQCTFPMLHVKKTWNALKSSITSQHAKMMIMNAGRNSIPALNAKRMTWSV